MESYSKDNFAALRGICGFAFANISGGRDIKMND